MDYTNEQYRLMQRLAGGLTFDQLNDQEQEVLRYLDDQGIAEPRAFIKDGLWVLSQHGQSVLQSHITDLLDRAQQAAKETEKETQQKRQQRFENKISVLNLLIPFVTFILGIVVDHFTSIMQIAVDFCLAAIDWMQSLS